MESVVSYPDRGNGGRSSYRGNYSPLLIEDIICKGTHTGLAGLVCTYVKAH